MMRDKERAEREAEAGTERPFPLAVAASKNENFTIVVD
jgi:hypothetical protein